MLRWIINLIKTLLFKERVYKSKTIKLDPCWKHEFFKKGCPTCRSLNAQ